MLMVEGEKVLNGCNYMYIDNLTS